jgi:hypothetical protein
MAVHKRKFPGKFRTLILPSDLLIYVIHETYLIPYPLSLMIYLLIAHRSNDKCRKLDA